MKKFFRKTSVILAFAALLGGFAFSGCNECKDNGDTCLTNSECCSDYCLVICMDKP